MLRITELKLPLDHAPEALPEAICTRLGIAPEDTATWVGGFEYLQTLRLSAQVGAGATEPGNRIRIAELNDIDRRVLREALQAARRLQQRIELDYP